ncbi:MAG: 16S rRNA (cytosine(1402)-N(4))-methyltransferase RsmH [Sporolactobacillus sp.]|jgi:16S rRNA (cytosine1402-N4)-methyltransferase|nr:16S rRNA (cytosine(1402)-N(4))-methyltransferase RsmH [Sporolactobacillus sp.]
MYDHITVLKQEAVAGLNVRPDGIYVDATLGGGGHSAEIVRRLSSGRLYAFDRDQEAIDAAAERLAPYRNRVRLIKANFRNMQKELAAREVTHVDGILFDLGVSSPQFDRPERGFSYQHDGPLDMRMDQDQVLDAEQIVNEWSYEQLVHIFFMYGEEHFAKSIARRIESYRDKKPIRTTGELAELIREAIPASARRKGGHPARRVFQALRIAVNDELGSLDDALQQSLVMLTVGGRMAIITFQSLEDRLCKQFIKKYSEWPEIPQGIPQLPKDGQPLLKKIGKKPIIPTDTEIGRNRRSRSAKLRIAEKIRTMKEEEK